MSLGLRFLWAGEKALIEIKRLDCFGWQKPPDPFVTAMLTIFLLLDATAIAAAFEWKRFLCGN
jgi:hypothetical protein